jgi:hypothetical protein
MVLGRIEQELAGVLKGSSASPLLREVPAHDAEAVLQRGVEGVGVEAPVGAARDGDEPGRPRRGSHTRHRRNGRLAASFSWKAMRFDDIFSFLSIFVKQT